MELVPNVQQLCDGLAHAVCRGGVLPGYLLVFAYPGELQNTWSLARGAQRSRVEVSGALRSDSGDVLQSWCAAGLGISLREPWDVFEDLAGGRLVRVLPAWQSEPVTLSAVRVHRDRVSRRVEVLIEFLRERWRREPWAVSSTKRNGIRGPEL